jgi:hypothetical protein
VINIGVTEVMVFWVVTPCSDVVGNLSFNRPRCLHLQGEDRGSTVLYHNTTWHHNLEDCITVNTLSFALELLSGCASCLPIRWNATVLKQSQSHEEKNPHPRREPFVAPVLVQAVHILTNSMEQSPS